MTKPVARVKTIETKQNTIDKYSLYHVVDGYDWNYEHTDVSRDEVTAPGFFDVYRSEMRVGAVIEARLGVVADGIERVLLQVISAPRDERGGPIEVSAGPSTFFVPCRAVEDEAAA